MSKVFRPFFDDSGNYVDDGGKVFLGTKVVGGTPRFSNVREDYLSKCRDSDSPITKMLKDKAMYRQIKYGNASDKSLKRDAEYIQNDYSEKKRSALKKERYKRVERSITKYKKKYKTDPI